MKKLLRILPGSISAFILGFGIFVLPPSHASVESDTVTDSCTCPKPNCDVDCESQENLTFYTEKCENGAKVKSCAKPNCVTKTPVPEACLNKRAAAEVKSNTKVTESPSSERVPASNSDNGPEDSVGEVAMVSGVVWLMRENKKKAQLSVRQKIFKEDSFRSEIGGQLELQMKDGNEIHLTENSELKLSEYDFKSTEKKRAVLDLIKGKVRNRVNQKYEGASYYKVRTQTAVAGVRGTDFVVSYLQNEHEGMVAQSLQVDTLKGRVELEALDKALAVPAGNSATFIVPLGPVAPKTEKSASTTRVFSEDEIQFFIRKGYFTSLENLSGKQIAELDRSTRIQKERALASEPAICSSPQGKWNECLWTCENNPKGADRCRTDLPQVSCVRRRCNANGKWGDAQRLPASFYEECKPNQSVLKPCDY